MSTKRRLRQKHCFRPVRSASPLAALGALRLVKEGKLSLDEDVNAKLRTWRVPENEFTKQDKVTMKSSTYASKHRWLHTWLEVRAW
jgi:hypothetical protein